jgi:hypothetical protein
MLKSYVLRLQSTNQPIAQIKAKGFLDASFKAVMYFPIGNLKDNIFTHDSSDDSAILYTLDEGETKNALYNL